MVTLGCYIRYKRPFFFFLLDTKVLPGLLGSISQNDEGSLDQPCSYLGLGSRRTPLFSYPLGELFHTVHDWLFFPLTLALLSSTLWGGVLACHTEFDGPKAEVIAG